MCGITGIVHKAADRPVSFQMMQAMCQRIRHRGPDDEGILVTGSVGLGMRRLAIIDLEGGHQPMYNEDGSVAVVFNGEIYNYPELKRDLTTRGHRFRTASDTEVLVHGYEEWGDELPQHLNGMFAFALWDTRTRRLVLARDHIGIKPLYLFETDTMIAFASEVKALLVVPEVTRQLDRAALASFLTFGYTPTPTTLFQDITKLAPATTLVFENGRTTTTRYWDVQMAPDERSRDDWCDEWRAALDGAVRRQLMSDVPLGAFLSGGLDSSSIVASMRAIGADRVSTYAIGFGREDHFHDELGKAREVSRKFETVHHEIVVEPNVADLIKPLIYHLDEPVTDTSFLVTYLVSRLARETVAVILSGVGGDEVFAGYRRYLWPQFDRLYNKIPGVVDRRAIRPLVRRCPVDRGSKLGSLFRYARGYLDHLDLADPMRYQGYVQICDGDTLRALLVEPVDVFPTAVADYYARAIAPDPLGRMLYADMRSSLVDSLLAFTDKMTMAVSLEARVPLLDREIVELASRVPSHLKLRGLRGLKALFKETLAPRLPPAVIAQRKQGFGTPISAWFRNHLRPFVQDMLAPERLARRGLFDPATVSRLVDDHMTKRADRSEHIMALITFEVWHDVFLDGAVPEPAELGSS